MCVCKILSQRSPMPKCEGSLATLPGILNQRSSSTSRRTSDFSFPERYRKTFFQFVQPTFGMTQYISLYLSMYSIFGRRREAVSTWNLSKPLIPSASQTSFNRAFRFLFFRLKIFVFENLKSMWFKEYASFSDSFITH